MVLSSYSHTAAKPGSLSDSAFADEGSAVAPEGVDEPAIAVEAESAGLSLLGSSHTKAKSLGMHEA